MSDHCIKCGKDLTDFIGYIPSQGVSCLHCFIEYALEDEKKSMPTKSKQAKKPSLALTMDNTISVNNPTITS